MVRPTHGLVPPITFRLRVRRSSRCWFAVHVADSLTAMRKTMRKSSGWSHPQQLAAVDHCRTPDPKLKGLIGIIYFAKTHLGVGIVAHEMTHAALRYCEHVHVQVRHWEHKPFGDKGRRVTTADSEELLAGIVESLNKGFWNHAYRLGVARP